MKQQTSEADFIQTLESIAQEQKKLARTEIIPHWAIGIGEWLVINPWRVLIPLSLIVYVVFRLVLGTPFRELILHIFGGF